MYDVIIIGAGVVGTAIARELSKYALRTLLLEKESDVSCGTTKANSAIVHAGYDPEPGSLKGMLNTAGNPLFDNLCADLGVPLKRIGSLVVALGREELATLKELHERGLSNGVPGLQILGPEELRVMEPRLKESAAGALYAPTAGIVDPWELAMALAENALHNGVEIGLNSPVSAINRTERGYRVAAGGREIGARYVINAAGLSADSINNMVGGRPFKIVPVRGQYFLFDKGTGDLVRHIIFQCPTPQGKGVVILPTVHGNLLLGPTAEGVTARDSLETTAAGLALLREQAQRVVEGLPYEQVITSFAGIRAKTPAGDFIIAQSEKAGGFINVAAIDSPGLTAAPAIAGRVAGLLQEIAGPLPPNRAFNPLRKPPLLFRELPDAEKVRLIKKNPRYGRVICRCEEITEGEIVEAIHRGLGAATVDGIKRRTRAGMGRCQGGFCTPRVMNIIARETKMDLAGVTKNGEGSYILSGPTKGTGASGVTAAPPARDRAGAGRPSRGRWRYDLVAIGGGPAGMAAAIEARKGGVERVLVLERETELGGILQQCIHPGFGLHVFKEELTGPEYAERFIRELKECGIEYMLDTMVLHMDADKIITAVNPQEGLMQLESGAIILAMGCRERARGAISIPGSRPAGIFTAGTAQRFVNMEGYMVGKRAIIFGSGDIGLIMARRLFLEGAHVIAVVERKPYSEGLVRNRVQCLEDFGIPLMLSHTIVDIRGRGRLESVGIARTDAHKRPVEGTTRYVECDTLLLSRGLIPENELSRALQLDFDPVTGGPAVDEHMETTVPGIFACGNALHVHDVVDWVTEESRKAGRAAAGYLRGREQGEDRGIKTVPGRGVRYIVPQRISRRHPHGTLELLFRVSGFAEKAAVVVSAGGKAVKKVRKRYLGPGEMVSLKLKEDDLPPGAFGELIVEIEGEVR